MSVTLLTIVNHVMLQEVVLLFLLSKGASLCLLGAVVHQSASLKLDLWGVS